MKKKSFLGQFYTENYRYILDGLFIPRDILIIEPFAGKGDLLKDFDMKMIECYDIEPKNSMIQYRDTFENPPSYKNKWVLTNPPYLAKNKCKNKKYFEKYGVDDLYKCFLRQIIEDVANGGTIIIPLNFWTSIRKNDISLRRDFLFIYQPYMVKIFEENVFHDTSYSVCAFSFYKKSKQVEETPIRFLFCPSKEEIEGKLSIYNHFLIGGEIYVLEKKFDIYRITKENENLRNTNIVIKCIDHTIEAFMAKNDAEKYVDKTPKASNRTYAILYIEKIQCEEEELVRRINYFLKMYREKNKSLFLTNYRESKQGKFRKRISFDLFYLIVNICNEPSYLPYKNFLEEHKINILSI